MKGSVRKDLGREVNGRSFRNRIVRKDLGKEV